jgi:glucose/arabinose dehydrogenase
MTFMRRHASMFLLGAVLACQNAPAQGPAQRSPTPRFNNDALIVETVARGLRNPWGLALLPDGRFLVTERPGSVRIVEKDGRVSAPLAGAPAVAARGQGGMLDVTLDPQFAQNRLIYLSFSEPGDGGTAGTSVARARLGDAALEDVRVIYRQEPKLQGGGHFGSRIVFRNDGTIFITQGDRQGYRDRAQDLRQGMGKIARVNTDGSIPRDNPFVGRSDARPEIWSYGHRNLQGAALHPETGALWTVEHGAAGGDELNHPEAGKNYGWPVITYGRDYNGRSIGEGAVKEGMEQPVYYWDPVIAPSGLTFYTGDAFPGWKGNILIGSMAPGGLVRLVMTGDRVASEERYLGDLRERIRDVQQGPDGFLYVITDSGDGRILRLRPATR